MLLNPFVLVLTIYGTIMSGALGLLVWAFKGRFDLPGRLFLISELLRFPVIAIIAMANLVPEFRTGFTYFVMNSLFLISEVAFVLSAYALSRGYAFKHSKLAILAILIVCGGIEIARIYIPSAPYLLYSVVYGSICLSTAIVCNFKNNSSTYGTPFWDVLKYIEATFVIIALIRVVLFFYGEGFTPVQGGALSVVILVAIVCLLIFRYIAFQSICMTWAPSFAQENSLNRNLVRTLRERDRLLQKLAISNRRLGVSALASSIAHQLSQPLTGAALQAETVKRDLIEQTGQTKSIESLDRVSAQLRKMASLVANLRALFMDTHGKHKFHSLVALCDEILELVSGSSIAKGITFEKVYHSDPTIAGDAMQIQQVLINIIENGLQAIKLAQPKNPFMRVDVTQNDSFAILTIEDNGGGIAVERLPSLFELYETTKEDGVGIGLWLCKTIVERHSGAIFADNTQSGGARFTVQLPLGERPR